MVRRSVAGVSVALGCAPKERNVEPYTLVVMEHGSEWPAHIKRTTERCLPLWQEPNEGHLDLLRRTYGRLQSIERNHGTLGVAVLSCRDDASRATLDVRIPLARALLAAVRGSGSGRLDVVARASAPARAKQSLLALAGVLAEALIGSSASLSIKFGDAVAAG